MKIHYIRKSAIPNVFSLFWVDDSGEVIKDSSITLNFNPVLEYLGYPENITLVHYQAKPKYLRRFGVFHNGEYYSVDSPIYSSVPSILLCLDETQLQLPPNAVICYFNSVYSLLNNTISLLPS